MNKMKSFILGKDKDGQITRLLFFVPILLILIGFIYEPNPEELLKGLLTIISRDRKQS